MWSDDVVTLWLQYSTQWDSLAHQGAEFDADGDGVDEPVFYNGYRPGTDIVGPQEDAKGDGSGSLSFARHLGLEHMAAHGVQGRGVLVDLAHHLGTGWQAVNLKTLKEIMAADNVVVEPGDMLLLHTGFATQVLAWEKNPDPVAIHTTASYLDAHDPALLEWIAESRISALVADNYAVEGSASRRCPRNGTRCSRSTTSACSSSASRSASCGTSTTSRPGCANTTAAGSCSRLPR